MFAACVCLRISPYLNPNSLLRNIGASPSTCHAVCWCMETHTPKQGLGSCHQVFYRELSTSTQLVMRDHRNRHLCSGYLYYFRNYALMSMSLPPVILWQWSCVPSAVVVETLSSTSSTGTFYDRCFRLDFHASFAGRLHGRVETNLRRLFAVYHSGTQVIIAQALQCFNVVMFGFLKPGRSNFFLLHSSASDALSTDSDVQVTFGTNHTSW